MANVDMALDEIISKNRRPQRNRSAGSGKRFAPSLDDPLPSGGGRPFRRFGGNRGSGGRRNSFGGRFGSNGGRRSANEDIVWINIANLPDTVLTQDLQELFQDFNVFGVGVHYDEFGAHMGTADLFVDASSAKTVIQEFSNVAIDGSKIRFAIVSEQANATAQFARTRPTVGPRQPFRNTNRRRGQHQQHQRSNSGRSSRTYSRSRSRSPLGGGVGPSNRGGGGPSQQKNAQRNKTAEELDRELEQYMRGNKHPRI